MSYVPPDDLPLLAFGVIWVHPVSAGLISKYQSPKETGTLKHTDKPDIQTNTQLPTVIALISKSNT